MMTEIESLLDVIYFLRLIWHADIHLSNVLFPTIVFILTTNKQADEIDHPDLSRNNTARQQVQSTSEFQRFRTRWCRQFKYVPERFVSFEIRQKGS